MGITLKDIQQELEQLRAAIDAQERPLNLEEAAQYLHVSKSTLYKLTSKGQIAHYKSAGGKLISFLKVDLRAWLLKHRVASQEEIQRNTGIRKG